MAVTTEAQGESTEVAQFVRTEFPVFQVCPLPVEVIHGAAARPDVAEGERSLFPRSIS